MSSSKVCVIGLWHLGMINAACFADHGHKVTGVELDSKAIDELKKGKLPLYEPGLDELVKKNVQKGNLSFTADFKAGLKGADYAVIAFDTPVNENDTPNLDPIWKSIERSVPHLEQGCLLVISSQVPIGTCEQIRAFIKKNRKDLEFGIACIPENLKLGEAISRFTNPDILVIGTDQKKYVGRARQLYGFVDNSRIKEVNLRTAEMVKHAINSFLANQISFANEMGNFCDVMGVDWYDVAQALSFDQRVGKGAFLKSGLAFGGGTLARDVGVLRKLGRENGARTTLLDAVIDVNLKQNGVVVEKLRQTFGKLKGLRIGVLGLTYKPGTSTIRRSAAIEIIKALESEGARIKAYDPKAEFTEKEAGIKIERCKSAALVADSADALLILTAWPEFKEMDLDGIKKRMSKAVIIDAMNMVDPERARELGFTYMGIGRGAVR